MSNGEALRVEPDEYRSVALRAHALLSDVPLHDAWAIDLDGAPGRTVADVRALITLKRAGAVNPAARLLFGLRFKLGDLFGWDREPADAAASSYIHRLTPQDRAASLVPPGTREGLFTTLYLSARESIGEIQNATVHGFSVFALRDRPGGYRLYWGIYVKPVGRITGLYMQLIDPFRRYLIYPSLLRSLAAAWSRREAA